MAEENSVYGTIVKDEGEYNIIASFAGAEELDQRKFINIIFIILLPTSVGRGI